MYYRREVRVHGCPHTVENLICTLIYIYISISFEPLLMRLPSFLSLLYYLGQHIGIWVSICWHLDQHIGIWVSICWHLGQHIGIRVSILVSGSEYWHWVSILASGLEYWVYFKVILKGKYR